MAGNQPVKDQGTIWTPYTGATTSLDMGSFGVSVADQAYGVTWNGSLEVPTKNAVYDKIEALTAGSGLVSSVNSQTGAVALVLASVDFRNQGTTTTVLHGNAAGDPSWSQIVNADVGAGAAIAYSKLALTGSIVNADVSGSAAIAYSKLALTGAILNADLAGSIAATKLVGTDITIVGDIATGRWMSSTAVQVAYGGSGATSFTAGAVLTGNGTSAFNPIAVGSSNQIFAMNNAGTAYENKTLSLGTTAQSNDLGWVLSGGNAIVLHIPDASATVRGVVTTGAQTFNGVKTLGSIPVGPNTDPTTSNQLTRKAYVDALFAGLASPAKQSCRAATTVAGTLATSFENGDTIDGVVLATGDRILIKNQAAPAENGIYTVNASGAPTRGTDYDIAAEVAQGTYTFINAGTVNTGTLWIMNSATVTTLNTDPITFAQIGTANNYNFGVGTTGSDFNVDVSGLNVTFHLPTASASNRGALSTSDWSSFNSKIDGAGTVVTNRIVTFSGTGGKTVQDSGTSLAKVGIVSTLTSSGQLSIYSGDTGTSGANSISIIVTDQSGTQTVGGPLTLAGGAAKTGNLTGGLVQISGGEGIGTGAGGAVTINGGTNAIPATGGKIIFGGGKSDRSGGDLTLIAGLGNAAANGLIKLQDVSSGFAASLDTSALTGNRTIIIPNAAGTFAISASGNIALSAAGNVTFTGTLPVANGGFIAADVQIFTATGTWTKPTTGTPKSVFVIMIGAGGGGGGGRKGAAATARVGGGGATSGSVASQTFAASVLGATETVTIPTGGTAGLGRSTNDTTGGNGSQGQATSFGTWLTSGVAPGGNGGGSGSGGSGGGTTVNQGFPYVSGQTGGGGGSSASTTGAAGSNTTNTSWAGSGGASGGGITTANAASNGGAAGSTGGGSTGGSAQNLAGGTAGNAAGTVAGGAGTSSATSSMTGGTGGGGGASSITTNAGAGGNGGIPGGGGGGGGAAVNSVGNSGAGGTGGRGECIVITYF